jgi:hypothetical protein
MGRKWKLGFFWMDRARGQNGIGRSDRVRGLQEGRKRRYSSARASMASSYTLLTAELILSNSISVAPEFSARSIGRMTDSFRIRTRTLRASWTITLIGYSKKPHLSWGRNENIKRTISPIKFVTKVVGAIEVSLLDTYAFIRQIPSEAQIPCFCCLYFPSIKDLFPDSPPFFSLVAPVAVLVDSASKPIHESIHETGCGRRHNDGRARYSGRDGWEFI